MILAILVAYTMGQFHLYWLYQLLIKQRGSDFGPMSHMVFLWIDVYLLMMLIFRVDKLYDIAF